ncbi:CcdC protein domain-containing protein [Halobacillus seohaensis]|uniref:CcdC family protein n=1 Tax=Halobacillus seohaensis TaxID=447421 RepID=A0ABW2EHG5_9BACI
MFWIISSSIVAAMMAVVMIFVRLRAAKRPASVKKIILPPFFMSTGALMFMFPVFRVEWTQVLEAVFIGVIFSILLIRSSKFEVREGQIYLIPSRYFVYILFGLLVLRIVLKIVIGASVSYGETSGMFFLLALGMIITWRLAMLKQYLQIEKTIS